MRVTVRIHGAARPLLRGGGDRGEFEVPDGSLVRDLLDAAGITPGDLWAVAVDGCLVPGDHPLRDGDEVLIFAPADGG